MCIVQLLTKTTSLKFRVMQLKSLLFITLSIKQCIEFLSRDVVYLYIYYFRFTILPIIALSVNIPKPKIYDCVLIIAGNLQF